MNRRQLLTGCATGMCLLPGCSSRLDRSEENETADNESADCATTVEIEGLAMKPSLPKGAEVCIVQYESYEPTEDPTKTGVVPVETGREIDYEKLGGAGDIIRYYPDDNREQTPLIARAIRWENGSYITKGDQNEDPYPWEAPLESIIGVVKTVL